MKLKSGSPGNQRTKSILEIKNLASRKQKNEKYPGNERTKTIQEI